MSELDLTKFDGHTPGGWSIPHFAMYHDDPKACKCEHVLADNYMGAVADVRYSTPDHRPSGDNPPLEEAIANARLIAAAPDLLAEVKRLRAENVALRAMGRDAATVSGNSTDLYIAACEENDRLRAELAALRTRVLEWVTVTEDPASLPERMREVLLRHNDLDQIVSWIQPNGAWGTPYTGHCEDEGLYSIEWPIEPGDRWAYIPEAQ